MKLKKTSLFYGIAIAAAIIVYFLILSIFGLHTYPAYSAFDIVIMGIGLYLLISKYKSDNPEIFKYQGGFWVMFRAGIIATLIITVFFAFYITEFNKGFLMEMLTTWEKDYSLEPISAIFGLALMGFSISLVFSLSFMQLFKRTWNTEEGKKHQL